jgi:hypothetical protein
MNLEHLVYLKKDPKTERTKDTFYPNISNEK